MPRKKYRELWLSKGLCGECGKNPVLDDSKYCFSCTEQKRLASIRKLTKKKDKGICNDCSNPRAENSSFCESCLAKRKEKNRARRASFKDNGLCTRCGQPRYEKFNQCKKCLDRHLKPSEWHKVLDQQTDTYILISENMVGEKINGLTVIDYSYKNKNHHYWLCECECGAIHIVCQVQLKKRFNRCDCQRGNG